MGIHTLISWALLGDFLFKGFLVGDDFSIED